MQGQQIMSKFYKLKYYVIESFYEHIIEEKYTIRQSVDRCFYEFGKQLSEGGLSALAVYSTLFYRVACDSAGELEFFRAKINEMNELLTTELRHVFSEDELEDLTDEIDTINQKLK